MQTNSQILIAHGYSDLAVEYPELEIPVLSGAQRQGDVLIVPTHLREGGKPLGKGVEVVRSEAGSNTHCLHGDGTWLPAPDAATALVQGYLSVPEGGEAYLIHSEEHGAMGIGPGSYEVRRQQEWAGEWRRVAD
jgi:hypothetical protein